MKLFLTLVFASVISVGYSAKLICTEKNQKVSLVTPVCPLTCDLIGKKRCLGLIDKPSCQCVDGTVFLSNSTRQCVEIKDCPKHISETSEDLLCTELNEHVSKSTPACPTTCQRLGKCFAILAKPSCQCNPSYLRDEISGKCVLREQCPKK